MTMQVDCIAALNRHWAEVAGTSRMSRSLRKWRSEIEGVRARTADELVDEARFRPPGQRECCVLDELVRRTSSEELALDVVIQAMLPRWCSIIASTRHQGLSRDEIASLVVSLGTETILMCRVESAITPTDYRLWSDTRHRVHRYLARYHPPNEMPHSPVILATRHAESLRDEPPATCQDLGRWISRVTGVPRSVATLVATTRTGATTLDAIAQAEGVKYSTVAQRRARAERRLRHALTAS